MGVNDDASSQVNLLERIKLLEQIITNVMPQANPDPEGQFLERFATLEDGFYKKIFTANGYVLTPDYHSLAEYMVEVSKLVSTDSYCYMYEDNFYQYISPNTIASKIDLITKRNLKPAHLQGFTKLVMAKSNMKEKILLPTDGLLNLTNGILDVKANKLIPHSHNYFFKYKLPHLYDPAADCPRFKKFLNFIFEKHPDYVDITAEIFGYCLLGGSQYLHKSFILYGEGRNGKSTWLDILKALLGHQNVSGVSLANLTKPFSVVNLDGKLANIVDETPNDQIDAEAFKTATSGGWLTGAHKGKPEYQVKCDARFLFATNRLPNFNESSIGIKERLYFIRFDQYIDPKKRDSGISRYIISQEMSGVLNFAIEGLQRLVKRGYLGASGGNDSTMDEFKMESDNVYEFYREKIEIDLKRENFISNATFYSAYQVFCEESGRRPMSRTGFIRRFASAIKGDLADLDVGLDALQSRPRDDTRGRVRGFKHVYIRSEF